MNLLIKKLAIMTMAIMVMIAMFGFGEPAFAASSVNSLNISPTVSECFLSGAVITASGNATADAPPGQLNQYHVQVSWGDGAATDSTETSSFSLGNIPDQGTNSANYTDTHTYTTPGTYTITARIWHGQPPGNDNQADSTLSETICIVSPLVIDNDAETSFTRTWDWSIDKTAATSSLTLADGELYSVGYDVDVDASSSDSDFQVDGTVTITNPLGNPSVTIETISDTMGSSVICPGNLPETIAPGGSLVCTYSSSPSGSVSVSNTVSITTDIPILDDSNGGVSVAFNDPTTETDECITVNDTNSAGPQDEVVCADDAPANFSYSLDFGKNIDADVQLICGANTYTNTADFVTNDTAAVDSDTATVDTSVACVLGCTLTQGYWKTHNDSFKGGAPTDDNWDNLAGSQAELTSFFSSGKSWFDVFWTAPKGNVYYNLAHQYMAAWLNDLNGADMPASVQTAFNSATTLLTNNTPTQAGALKGSAKSAWTNLAGTLGNFNEGNAGIPHCDEQNP
jgi:hypothetical protein